MKHLPRIALGLLFFVPGILKLVVPWDIVAPNYGGGELFMTAVKDTGYLFVVLAVSELIPGLMLLVKRWVPFALTLIGPVLLNIVCFHLFLDVTLPGVAISVLVTALWIWMVRSH